MYLPKQLVESFEEIKSCSLIAGVITIDSIQSFVDALNRAIPSSLNVSSYAVYRFNRSKYLIDKARFLSEIKDFAPFDAMILWTDFADILSYFNLTGKIFLGWDKSKNRYRGFAIAAETPIKILRRGETLSSVLAEEKKTAASVSTQTEALPVAEDMESEMERLYKYMQQRLAGLTEPPRTTESSSFAEPSSFTESSSFAEPSSFTDL